MKNLLVELFVEELPPKALKKLGESFASVLVESLKAQGLVDATSVATSFASPRRLGVHLTEVAAKAADRAVQQKLMPVAVALNAEGQATPALLKKLAAVGAGPEVVPQLKRLPDGKAEALFWDSVVPGATLAEGLQKALDETLAKLPIPKVMTYQLADGWSDVKFVRPAHGLVALHGSDVVPVHALGLTSGRETRGHRFEAALERITIAGADGYVTQLREQGAVIAGFAERRAEIVSQLNAASGGLKPIDDEALLDEVTALVERPNVLACQFEPEFLAVPQECLILTMKANQKYFPLLDAAGKLTNKFLVVSNIRPADASAVTGGNERVVRPRLADAKFFFDQDRKKPLAARVAGLAKVVYHGKLGTQGERMLRVRMIAMAIAKMLGADDVQVREAAMLAKADLLTDMVGEFPELQGIMGGYYARHDGLNEAVAFAIEDHYKPRFAGDALPRNSVGTALAIADKLETLVGLFGIGQTPTGDKDPFALRRHALGVVRLLAEQTNGLSQRQVIDAAIDAFPDDVIDKNPSREGVPLATVVDVFMNERAVGYWQGQGFSAREVDAVLEVCGTPSQFALRLTAVQSFAALPEAASLAAANKRVNNILKKSETPPAEEVHEALLREPAEHDFLAALRAAAKPANEAYDRGDYTASLLAWATLKTPVDAFFDSVMVNAEDLDVRRNRLRLLFNLRAAMNRVADLSRLAT